jgi:2-oxoglutarate dehydrogenase E2 component (dihydrolipoamide succinyltransferase)
MTIEIRVPSPGESVQQVVLAAWLKADGAQVEQDEELLELESEKATLMVAAPAAGVLRVLLPAGAEAQVGQLAGTIEAAGGLPVEAAPTLYAAPPAGEVPAGETPDVVTRPAGAVHSGEPRLSPAARKLAAEQGLDAAAIAGSGPGGRVTKGDVLAAAAQTASAPDTAPHPPSQTAPAGRAERRSPLSPLRQKLGERLVAARNQSAMLTTFNEADLSRVQSLRARVRERFREVHGTDLGLMGFFALAAVRALLEHPQVNSRLEGGELVEPQYVDLGIAVSAPKGLVVPVIRNAESLALEQLEAEIARLAARARENRVTLEEMSGGTFTISNGGVFGSLLSTPILNPPQCAILGLHAIQERPVAVEGRVEIRPMMYLALSYDHRLIDGRESVTFLKRIVELVEEPARLLLKV